MKTRKKIYSIIIAVLCFGFSFPNLCVSANTAGETNWKEKIHDDVWNQMEESEDNELIPVWIWFNDIDFERVELETQKITGISKDDLRKNDGFLASSDLEDYLIQSLDNEITADQSDSINYWPEYLEATKKERQSELLQVRKFNKTKRMLASNRYFQQNSTYISALSVNENTIIFISSLTPSAIISLTKSSIIEIAQKDFVSEIFLEKMVDECEPSVENEKSTMRVDYVSSYFHLTGNGTNVLAIDTNFIRPDVYTSYTFQNLTNIYNVYNQQCFSVSNTSTFPDPTSGHATLVSSRLQDYAPGVTIYGTTKYRYSDIEWALENCDIDIINGSVNYGTPTSYTDIPITKWYDALVEMYDVPLVASAGNSYNWSATNWPNVISPACGYNCIAVGAYTTNGNSELDYRKDYRYNPTNSITSVNYKPDVMIAAGSTSEAAPALTGIISFLFEIRPSLISNPEEVKAIVMASCHRKLKPHDENDVVETIDDGLTQRQGAGAVDAYRALRIVLNNTYGMAEINNGSIILQNNVTVNYLDNLNVSIAWNRKNTATSHDSVTLGTLQELELNVYNNNTLVGNSNKCNTNKQMAYVLNASPGVTYRIGVTKNTVNSETVEFGYAWSERGFKQLSYISMDGKTAHGKTLSVTARKIDWNIPTLQEVKYVWKRSSDNLNWYEISDSNSNSYTLTENDFLNYIKCEVIPLNSSLLATSTLNISTDLRVIKYGDANLDGEIDTTDVDYIQDYLAEIITLTDEERLAGDITGDGVVNILDVTCYQMYFSGFIDTFPVETD